MKFNANEFLMDAVVPAVAINAAGFVEPKLDNWVNANIKYISSNAAVNPKAKYAKYMKAGLYTGVGLIVQAADMMFGSKKTEKIADTVADFTYGLSAATIAEDPVLNIPNPQYRMPGAPSATPSTQVVVRTGNVIS